MFNQKDTIMTAEITMSQLWWNPYVMGFFFRNQAQDTLEELMDNVAESTPEVLDAIENYTDDLDEVEEILYNEPMSVIIETFGLTPIEDED